MPGSVGAAFYTRPKTAQGSCGRLTGFLFGRTRTARTFACTGLQRTPRQGRTTTPFSAARALPLSRLILKEQT
jgi:hypothetical protein